jgi:hypothetical protein
MSQAFGTSSLDCVTIAWPEPSTTVATRAVEMRTGWIRVAWPSRRQVATARE